MPNVVKKYRFDQIAINSIEKKKPTEDDRLTYLGLEHLDSGSLKVTRYGTEVAPIGEKLIMKKGDVLFGKRRAYQKKVAIAPFDGIFSAHGMVLRPKEDVVDKDFFPLFISSDYFLDAAIKISVGSLSPTINWRDLKELEFELPDLCTQKRLAAVLWAMNETMDSYKELISATDGLAKARFIEMFEGKGYPAKKGKELFKFSSGKFLSEERRLPNGIPVYGGNGIAWYTDESLVDEDTIVIGRVGAYCGNVHLARGRKWITDNAIYISKFLSKDFALTFLESLMKVYDFHQYAGVSGQPKITQKPLEEQLYIIPPADKQTQFADFMDQSDRSKLATIRALEDLQVTQKALIRKHIG